MAFRKTGVAEGSTLFTFTPPATEKVAETSTVAETQSASVPPATSPAPALPKPTPSAKDGSK